MYEAPRRLVNDLGCHCPWFRQNLELSGVSRMKPHYLLFFSIVVQVLESSFVLRTIFLVLRKDVDDKVEGLVLPSQYKIPILVGLNFSENCVHKLTPSPKDSTDELHWTIQVPGIAAILITAI